MDAAAWERERQTERQADRQTDWILMSCQPAQDHFRTLKHCEGQLYRQTERQADRHGEREKVEVSDIKTDLQTVIHFFVVVVVGRFTCVSYHLSILCRFCSAYENIVSAPPLPPPHATSSHAPPPFFFFFKDAAVIFLKTILNS